MITSHQPTSNPRRSSGRRATAMLGRVLLAGLFCSAAGAAWAQDAVPGFGTMRDIPGAVEKPSPQAIYKLVFDVKTLPDSFGQASPSLEPIAVLINTYRHYGVPTDHLQVTAVFHGSTIVLLADDATFRDRTGFPANPNTAILAKLRQAGVRILVCGQSALAQHYDLAMLRHQAEIALSATVTFINLQSQGFVKIED